jgi:hypothetical protein
MSKKNQQITNITSASTLKINKQGLKQEDDVALVGGIYIDTDTLYVDNIDRKIGINNKKPLEALDICGNLLVSGTITARNIISEEGIEDSTITLTNVGSSPNADGATITNHVLQLQPASSDFPGLITTNSQTISGIKTFTNTINASDIVLSGNLTAINTELTGNLTAVDAELTGNLTAVNAELSANLTATDIDLSGNLTAVNAELSGTLDVSGTITGSIINLSDSISAVDGNFSGSLVAANLSGTNTGNITLGSVINTSTANGATLTGQQLQLNVADGTNAGLMSTVAQTFSGNKTFNDDVIITGTLSSSNFSGTNTGDVTLGSVINTGTTNGATLTGQQLRLNVADASNPGIISTGSQTFSGAKTFNDDLTVGTTLSVDTIASQLDISGNITATGTIAATGTITGSNLSGSNTGDITLAAVSNTSTSLGASLSGQQLTLHVADNVNAGLISTTTQTFAGNKTFNNDVQINGVTYTNDIVSIGSSIDIGCTAATNTVNIGCSDTVQTINFGSGTGVTTINIGGSNDTVNLNGTVNSTQQDNLDISNNYITLNAGASGSGTARNSGIHIRDNNSDTQGYIQVSSTGDYYVLRAPEPSVGNKVLSTPILSTDDTVVAQNTIDTLTNKTFGDSPTFSTLSASSIVLTNATKQLSSTTLTNGQILIGNTGNSPTATTITGTTNQINVTSGAGSITLSTPQNINTTATPTFASETLSATSNQLILGTLRTVTLNAPTPVSTSRTHTIPDITGDGTFAFLEGSQTFSGSKVFSSQVNINTATNQLALGSSNTIILNSGTPSANRTYTFPDVGTNSSFVMTDSNQTINNTKTFSSAVIINPTTNQLVLGATTTVTLNAPTPVVSSRTHTIPDISGNGTFAFLEGTQTITGLKTFSTAPTFSASPKFTAATNQLTIDPSASGVTFSINAATPLTNRVVTIPDPLNDASFVMSEGAMTINGSKTFGSGIAITPASNQLVLGNTRTVTLTAPTPLITNRTHTIPDISGNGTFAFLEGTQTFSGSKTYSAAITVTPVTNQLILGTTNTVTLNAAAPAASRTYTIPDTLANSSFIMSDLNQTINGNKTFNSRPNFVVSGGAQLYISKGDSTNGYYIDSVVPSAPRTVTLRDMGADCDFILSQGAQTIAGTKSFSTRVNITNSSGAQIALSTGGTFSTFIGITNPSAQRAYTIPDVSADASFIMSEGTQTINGAKTLSGITTVSNTTDSTASTNGALIVSGGIGVAKNMFMSSTSTIDFGAGVGTKLRLYEAGASDYEIGIASNTLYMNVASTSDGHEFRVANTAKVRVQNAGIIPSTSSSYDIGGASNKFQNGYIDTVFLSTSGGTASSLNYYEEATISGQVGGPWGASSIVCTFRFTRIGKIVHLQYTQVNNPFSTNTNSYIYYSTVGGAETTIPTRFWPADGVVIPVRVINGNVMAEGTFVANTSGNLQWYLGDTGFANFSSGVTLVGFYTGSVTWRAA